MTAKRQVHPFPPVADARARVLILGSFPSVRSRAVGFYYGHPRNRFWQVMAAVLEEPVPLDTQGRVAWLEQHGVALWDVLASCDIQGSSDASIQKAVPNDLRSLVFGSSIRSVFANGAAAGALYRRFFAQACLPAATVLPSTSPANAAWSLEHLVEAWRAAILPGLG